MTRTVTVEVTDDIEDYATRQHKLAAELIAIYSTWSLVDSEKMRPFWEKKIAEETTVKHFWEQIITQLGGEA